MHAAPLRFTPLLSLSDFVFRTSHLFYQFLSILIYHYYLCTLALAREAKYTDYCNHLIQCLRPSLPVCSVQIQLCIRLNKATYAVLPYSHVFGRFIIVSLRFMARHLSKLDFWYDDWVAIPATACLSWNRYLLCLFNR